jgi:UDP-N-acetylglucosamine 2-epimerase (non-hydrolysing)
MAQKFIEDLELPAPDYIFKLKEASPSIQIARIIAQMDNVLSKTLSSTVLVEGDTNTVLATAIAANKHKNSCKPRRSRIKEF